MYVVCWSLLRRQFSPSLIEKGSSNWKKDLGIIFAVLGVPFHGRWSRHHISFSLTPWILLQHLVSLFCTVSGFHTENMYLSIEKFQTNEVLPEVGLPESISHSVILLFLVRRKSSCNPWHSLMVFYLGRKKRHGRPWHIMWDSFTIRWQLWKCSNCHCCTVTKLLIMAIRLEQRMIRAIFTEMCQCCPKVCWTTEM